MSREESQRRRAGRVKARRSLATVRESGELESLELSRAYRERHPAEDPPGDGSIGAGFIFESRNRARD